MSNKVIKSYIKMQVLSGKANPSPPVGPVLGQRGLNIMDFCKSFNEKTSDMESGIPIPVIVTVYSDRSFDFIIKSPPSSYLIKKRLSIVKASNTPGVNDNLIISMKDIVSISKIKLKDFNTYNEKSIIKSIIGTAKSMGVLVK